MRFKDISLKSKIGLSVCSAVLVVLVTYSVVVVVKTRQMQLHEAEQIGLEMANRYGNAVKGTMEAALDASLTTASVFQALVKNKSLVDRESIDNLQKEVILSNSTFYGIQSCFEPNALDGKDAQYKATGDPMWEHMGGAYGNYWWRENGDFKVENLTVYDYPNTRAWYMGPRDSGHAILTEPYFSPVAQVNMATISVPVRNDGRFIGIVGIDFTLSAFQAMVDKIKPMETGYAFIVSNQGKIVAHPNPNAVNKNIIDNVDKAHAQKIVQAVRDGKPYSSFITSQFNDVEYLYEFQPIFIRGTETPWSVGIALPKKHIFAAADEFVYLSIILTVSGILVLTVLIFLIARSITSPLIQGIVFAKEIANGNLVAHIDIDQKDEVGVLATTLGEMGETLRSVVADVRLATDSVASGAEELASTSESLSEGATQQAAAIEEVSSSVEEMASNISQNADNASQTKQLASGASGQAADGGRAVAEAVEAMKEIANKISIIEDIARQTNLLALNAAIEAARAGEHGKGFAVVAAEVRKLAERSGVAAGEISQLAVSSVEVADRAGELLGRLVPDIQQTAELVNEISSATNEQNAGAGQINSAIQQLDGVVQQNASASEEMSSTSAELSTQSTRLQKTVAFFNIGKHPMPSSSRVQAVREQPKQLIVRSLPAAKPTTGAAAQPTGGAASAASSSASVTGVTLDMGDDSEFEQY